MLFRDQQPPSQSIAETTQRSRRKKTATHLTSIKHRGGSVSSSVPDTLIEPGKEDTVWTPTTIQKKLEQLIHTSELSAPLWVQGELNNYSPCNRSGHMYFDIKDNNNNKLSCTLFGVQYVVAQEVHECLANGVRVAVRGSIKCISKFRGSQYQCNVRKLKIVCEDSGASEKQLQEWTAQLKQEGVFEAVHKRALPSHPQHIAVITSQNGAAWQDVRQTVDNTHIQLQLTLYPCLVQGDKCVSSILRQLQTICDIESAEHKPDVVLITRGGGSREDLWEFNQPSLARGVHAMRSVGQLPPVVCAIGHQVDTPLLDSVCDASFITPTYAAQQLVKSFADTQTAVSNIHQRLCFQIKTILANRHMHYARLHTHISEHNIVSQLQNGICAAHTQLRQRVQQGVHERYQIYLQLHTDINQSYHLAKLHLQQKDAHTQLQQCVHKQLQKMQQQHETINRNVHQAMPWCVLVDYPDVCILQNTGGDTLDINTMGQRRIGRAMITSSRGHICFDYKVRNNNNNT